MVLTHTYCTWYIGFIPVAFSVRKWKHIRGFRAWGCANRPQASLELRVFALASKIHFEAEESFVLAEPEKSNVSCHSALKGKGLIWVWILILTAIIFSAYVTWGTGEKANSISQSTEALSFHMQFKNTVVSGFTPIQVICGSNNSTYSSSSCFVSSVKGFFPSSLTPIPLLSLCLVFFHTLFPKRLAGLTMHCDFFSTGLYEGSWRQFSLVSLTSFITYQRNKQTESNSFDHGKSRKSIKNPMKIH